jgi:D-alanyl-D-alanine carboxypeptidase/D-alanyl-D-alanine-endopeptidase (penicillin-binding protein 4)
VAASHRVVAVFVAAVIAMTAALGSSGCFWRDGRTAPLPSAHDRAARRAAQSAAPTGGDADPFPLAPASPLAGAKAPAPVRALRATLDRLYAAPELAGSLQAVVVIDLGSDEVLYAHHPDIALRPASALKILTSAALLDHYGPSHQITTPVSLVGDFAAEGTLVDAIVGEVDAGFFDGALLIEGRGDPSISGRYDIGGLTTGDLLDEWASQVAAAGVRRLRRGIIIDDRWFATDGANDWWELEDWGASYAAPISALALHENCFDLRVAPATNAGDDATITVSPPNESIIVAGRVTTVPQGETSIRVERSLGSNMVRISGRIAVGAEPFETWRAVTDGSEWAGDLIARALERHGVNPGPPARRWSRLAPGELRVLAAAPRRELFRYESRSLFQIITIINKPSQNFYADMMLAALARDVGPDDSPEARDAALRAFLRRIGVDPAGLAVADGSGLSWRNLATARQLAETLRAMERHPHAAEFYNSLPIAGLDGTMANRLTEPPAAGNARAKTGYINRTRAMAGYVTCRDGRRLAFALIANNYLVPTARINALHDAVVQALAGWERE